MPTIYKAKIISHGLAVSEKNHVPEVKIQLKTISEIPSGTPIDKTLFADLWMSEKAAENTLKTLRSIGYNEDSMANLNSEILVGTIVEVVTDWSEYNGVQREQVRFINPDGNYAGRGVKQCDPKVAANICGKYDAMLRNIAKSKNAAKKAEAPNPYSKNQQKVADQFGGNPVEDDEDGLPF